MCSSRYTRLEREGRPGLALLTGLAAIAVLACGEPPSPVQEAVGTLAAYPWARARPPIPPRWVLEPWVWEDDENTEAATLALVEGYRSRGIPAGAVIIDSPWQQPSDTGYHSLDFDPERYPTPKAMIRDLHAQGVRVVLWITGNIAPEAPLWREACEGRFFVRRADATNGGESCPTTSFWKAGGRAAHLDFFSPAAITWWSAQLDRALALGADGWKVDGSDFQVRELGDPVLTADGAKHPHEYSAAMYRFFFEYTRAQLGADRAAILARPYADDGKPAFYAPLEWNTAGWVGDQEHDWEGLREALFEVLVSARAGYAVVGSDIGGLKGQRLTAELFVRWAQLGSLLPLMNNGGRDEHRPWRFAPPVLEIYREFALLHHALVPYFYHLAIGAHRSGTRLVQPVGEPGEWPGDWRYLLGDALLVAPLVEPARSRRVRLPAGTWLEWFDLARVHPGGTEIDVDVPLDRYPLFVRAGSVLPWNDDDERTTVLVFPHGRTEHTLHLDPATSVDLVVEERDAGLRVSLGASRRAWTLRVHRGAGRFEEIRLDTDGRTASAEVP
jgi:alpha-glucosidase (family GH31 glycosyl hydrolase)